MAAAKLAAAICTAVEGDLQDIESCDEDTACAATAAAATACCWLIIRAVAARWSSSALNWGVFCWFIYGFVLPPVKAEKVKTLTLKIS